MTPRLVGRRGSCTTCGKRGPLRENGRPMPHGMRIRRTTGVVVLPGVCPGCQVEAERQTLFGRPLAAIPDLPIAAGVPVEPLDPAEVQIGSVAGNLLARIENSGVFRQGEHIWQLRNGRPESVSRRAVDSLVASGWVELGDRSRYQLTFPLGKQALALARIQQRQARRALAGSPS